jgi:hypothetical protein
MRRVNSIVALVALFAANSILPIANADVIPKNPQLTSANATSIEVKRGEVFTVTVGVNAFDGYIYSAGGSFYSTFSLPQQNTGFECRGYVPVNGDSSKVLVVQNGSITLKCVVPRSSLEGIYRLWYFDLSSVGCKKTFVMEISNPAGVSCPNSWTHYAYRSGYFDKPAEPYATENQTTSLNYPVDTFISFPTIKVSGMLALDLPEITLTRTFSDRISASYYFGSAWDRDMRGLCAIDSNLGTLTTNMILTSASLPLNLAAQPQYNQVVNIEVRDLKPKTSVDLKITCKGSNGEIASKIYQFQSALPPPPITPTIRIVAITERSAKIQVLNFITDSVKYTYVLNGAIKELASDSLTLEQLDENSTNTLKVSATDSFGQISTSGLTIFRTTRSLVSITCVKGKLTKKVTAVKPKCPAGYKVKK